MLECFWRLHASLALHHPGATEIHSCQEKTLNTKFLVSVASTEPVTELSPKIRKDPPLLRFQQICSHVRSLLTPWDFPRFMDHHANSQGQGAPKYHTEEVRIPSEYSCDDPSHMATHILAAAFCSHSAKTHSMIMANRGCRKSTRTRMGLQHASTRVWSMLIRSIGFLITSSHMGNTCSNCADPLNMYSEHQDPH